MHWLLQNRWIPDCRIPDCRIPECRIPDCRIPEVSASVAPKSAAGDGERDPGKPKKAPSVTLTRIFSFKNSLAWGLYPGIFKLGALALDLQLWIFSFDLYLEIFSLGSLAWDLELGIFGIGSLTWDL